MEEPIAKEELDPLKPAIEKLETCLVTPQVPGELETWTANLRAAFAEVVEQMKAGRAKRDASLKEIARQDPELLTRVEQLKSERDEVWRHAQEMSEILARASKRAETAEPDEHQASKVVSDTVTRGLDFVIRLRSFEAALSTWFVEAFQRDRGVGD